MFNNAKLRIEFIIETNWILLDLELTGNHNRYLKNRIVVSSIDLYKKTGVYIRIHLILTDPWKKWIRIQITDPGHLRFTEIF